jgi:hypothetical protein
MSDESKQNVDELLSGYVDGELSKRKYTELKRLMEHDPELAEKFAMLKKQKQLLNAMPVETAPEGLFDAVIASQERKFILNEYSAASGESEGVKHLMFRRALTAAVIFVLFGGLVGIIAHIMSPIGQVDPPDYVKGPQETGEDLISPRLKPDKDPGVVNPETYFRATLDLKTEQAIAMNSFIMKAIFDRELTDFVNPREIEGASSTIRIVCGIDGIVALLGDIQAEWDKCKEANLSVYDHALAKDIVIENISSKDLMKVFNEDKFYARMQIVKDFADHNPYGDMRDVYGNDSSKDPVMPTLVESKLDKKQRLEGGEKVSLVITVTGL